MAIRPSASASELTAREREQMQHEKEMFEKQSQHALELKKLEYEIVRMDTQFSNWIKIPLTIVKLPILLVIALGFVIGSFREDYEPGKNFWDLLK